MGRRSTKSSWGLWLLAVLPLVLFGLAPLVTLVWSALTTGGLGSLRQFETWALLGRSLGFAGLVAALACIAGGTAGYALAARRFRGRVLLVGALSLPLVLPPYVHAVGWTALFAPARPVSRLFESTLGVTQGQLTDLVYSFPAAAAVLSLALMPVPFLFVFAAMSAAPYTLVEAAQNMGAGPLRVFIVARWPFLRVAAFSAALIVFLLASADLGVPTIFKVRVFNFEVFTQLGAFNDTAAATVLALPLIAVGLMAAAVERSAASMFAVRGDDRDGRTEGPPSRVGSVFALALASLLVLLGVVAPLGAVIVESLDSEALARAWAIAPGPAINTVVYAGAAAIAAAAIAFVVAWLGRSDAGRGHASGFKTRATEILMVLGFATPGAIIALGLLGAFGSPPASRFIPAAALVVAAMVVRSVVVAQRVIDAGVAAIPDSLIEAAQVAGASGTRIVCSIVIPLIAPHLAVAFAAAFILSSAEIGSTILLYPPGGETLPIALYAVEANSPRSLVAALTMMLVALPLVTAAGAAGVLAVLRWRRA